jgi:lipoprotein-anchoring transpeptidase ErfK/SrfK
MGKYYFSAVLLILSAASAFPAIVSAADVDADKDGLSDGYEQQFKTDPANPDTDSDGYGDGLEVMTGFDPLKADRSKLEKVIKLDLQKQELSRVLGGVVLGTYKVSTGKKSMPTPKGIYTVGNKSPKAWSKTYGLWMPYWLGIQGRRFGIHELPIWPNGYREGANHLGIPVSHGCIRLGIGPAKLLYNWAEIGTEVVIN